MKKKTRRLGKKEKVGRRKMYHILKRDREKSTRGKKTSLGVLLEGKRRARHEKKTLLDGDKDSRKNFWGAKKERIMMHGMKE